jgi:hypothetical protein
MLIDNNGDEIGSKNALDDIAVGTSTPLEEEPAEVKSGPIDDLLRNKALFVVVSLACLTAAVAAGSYAVWLSKQNAAEKALSNVHDLLKTCEKRMSQMDKDLKRLPRAQSA